MCWILNACTCFWVILFNDQLDTQFSFVYVYFNSLHVSRIQVLIIRRFNCINTISGICHPDRLVCRFGRSVQTCIPDSQGDIYQISYWYNWISWWWALECSKHAENWNKHTQKRTVCQVGQVQTCIPDGQGDIYQISYWYNWISWWWALECLKHAENWNKHRQKRTVCQVGH